MSRRELFRRHVGRCVFSPAMLTVPKTCRCAALCRTCKIMKHGFVVGRQKLKKKELYQGFGSSDGES